MQKNETELHILFCDTDKKLLSAVLRNLETYMKYAGYDKVILYTMLSDNEITDYLEMHPFFTFHTVDKRYLEEQAKKNVVSPKRNRLIINTSTSYCNNVLNLIGINDISLDDIVLIGLFEIPEGDQLC